MAHWRLLGPMAAMNGVLLFGWSTAVIFECCGRLCEVAMKRASRERKVTVPSV
jgi:hypothetical protein